MIIEDIIRLNIWDNRKFFTIVLTIQLAVWSIIYLDTVGLKIPVIRQVITFIYLTYIPGILILRILKLNTLNNTETLLYSVGLSISVLMFTGFLANAVYPILGIAKPISEGPLLILLSMIVLLLSMISYIISENSLYSTQHHRYVYPKDIKFILMMCLLPFLSIFGTFFFNYYSSNYILLLLIALISLVFVFTTYIKLTIKLYPFILWLVSISLLFHSSLMSTFLWGWDIFVDSSLAKNVQLNSIWNPSTPLRNNAMLSVVMLAPIFSNICGVNLIWVFKIIYPLLFSIVPVGLYEVFRRQFDDKTALLSCFFFMSVIPFYRELLQLPRQQIAELFLVLLILLTIDHSVNYIKKKILLIIFALSLIVSHYGTFFVFASILIITYAIYNINIRYKVTKELQSITFSDLMIICIVFALTWYIYFSSSSILVSVIDVIKNALGSIYTTGEVLNSDVLHFTIRSRLQMVILLLNFITQLLIVVGVFVSVIIYKNIKVQKIYIAFSIASLTIWIISIFIPHLVGYSSIDQKRLYHITLFFLSPYCVIGAASFLKTLRIVYNTIFRKASRIKTKVSEIDLNSSLKIVSIFFAVFFLFNSGFISEIIGDKPISPSLNKTMDFPRYCDPEIYGAMWIVHLAGANSTIYSDDIGKFLFYYYKGLRLKIFWGDTKSLPKKSYIYFRQLNTRYHKVIVKNSGFLQYIRLDESIFYKKIIIYEYRIYDNQYSQIFY